MYDFDPKPKKKMHPGVVVGLVGALSLMAVSIMLFLMHGAEPFDGPVMVLQVLLYFILGRTAASRQAELSRETHEPSRGVASAGVSATMITSILMWVYYIIRGIIMDAFGITVVVNLFFCGYIIIDVILAMGIGGLMGRAVEKQFSRDPFGSSNF